MGFRLRIVLLVMCAIVGVPDAEWGDGRTPGIRGRSAFESKQIPDRNCEKRRPLLFFLQLRCSNASGRMNNLGSHSTRLQRFLEALQFLLHGLFR